MKRLFWSLILSVVFICTLLPQLSLSASATTYSGACGDNLTWTLDTDTGVLAISGTGAMYNYFESTELQPWVLLRDSITLVQIGNGVTSIGNYAFYDLTSLMSVTIPDSVRNIGYYAFYNCDSLTSVTLGSVESIEESAFYGCKSLTSVIIPDSVTNIGFYAFYGCTNLGSVTIPGSVKNIRKNAFGECKSLTSVIIPDSVTSIGDNAFYGCTKLASVTIGDGVTSIGASAFAACSQLKSLVIGESVTSIGDSAFAGCYRLSQAYYVGTKEMWNEIIISDGNEELLDGTIYFNYILPEEPAEPEYRLDESLTFSMSISVGAEMKTNYILMADKVAGFEDFYLVVKKIGENNETVTTTFGIGEDRSEVTVRTNPSTGEPLMYTMAYSGINAKEMGDSFVATLYAVAQDGTIHYSASQIGSIKSYLIGKLEDSASSDELKTMVVDMLKYGALAQSYFDYKTDSLAISGLTAQQLAYGTTTLPEATDHSALLGEGQNISANITIGARVQLNLSCIYQCDADSDMKYVVKDFETREVLAELPATVRNDVMCQAKFEDVGAKQMRRRIMVILYDGDTVVSRILCWSVESYVAQVRAKTTATAKEISMVNAMLAYGDSVAAYMDKIGQS